APPGGRAAGFGGPAEVAEFSRVGEPQPEHRQQRLPARDHLRVVTAGGERPDRLVERVGPHVIELCRDHRAAPSERWASWMARHTRSGVHGIGTSVTPSGRSASTMAFTTAGVDAIVPASPTPLAPSGLSL